MAALIEVADLVKDFRTFERGEGFAGALKNLFRRRYKTVRAAGRSKSA